MPKGLPLVGRVAAGEPILAEENIEDYLQVPSTIKQSSGEFVLQVSGDSMKNVGIMDGDYVVVQPSKTADNGEIVIALMEDEATCKRFYKEPNRIRLEPENEELEPIYSDDLELAGKVVGVFRSVA